MLQADSDRHAKAGPRTMLLVEDNLVFQQLIERLVPRLKTPWRLHCVNDGTSALQYLEEENGKPDLALVDIGLPDMSGIDVIRQVSAQFPDTPILVMSVISSESSLFSAIRAGAHGYLLKDQSDEALLHAIEDVLAGNYPISPSLARYLFRMIESPAKNAEGLSDLTPREIDVLREIGEGASYAEVADKLEIAISTVQTHIRSLYKKLGVHSQVQAARAARDIGLL